MWKSWELKKDRSLLHTFVSSANAQVLYIECESWHVQFQGDKAPSILVKLLPNMLNSVDLRVVYDEMTVDPSEGVFSRAIRFVCCTKYRGHRQANCKSER